MTGLRDYSGQFGTLEGYLILCLIHQQTIEEKQFWTSLRNLSPPSKHVLI